MPGTNLTRAEAAERSASISVDSYDVTLDLTVGPTTYTSRTHVRFECRTPGVSTWVDLIAPTVRRIEFNGRTLDPAEVFVDSRIALDELLATNELIVDADCAYMHTGEGLHRFVDPVDDEVYLYSQFEVADARRMYACMDQPDLKATFALTVTAPNHWHVLSNTAAPQPVAVSDTASRWRFAPTSRLSPYITALAAGPYHAEYDTYVGPHGTYPLGVYCRSSLGQYLDADEIMTITKQGFEFFEKSFDSPYPFKKYDQIFVPEFNAGAMENAACVTYLEEYVFRSRVTDAAYEQRSNTILHEMAHMWFGDLVTMTWWDDLWLNESFAEWAAHHANVEATRFTDAWTTFLNQRKAWAYRQDQLPSTHPIAADMLDLEAVEVNFDGITYAKGAAALRQLVAWVGEKEFFDGIQSYFREHAWGNTRLDDLLRHLEISSDRELASWSREWLQTSGVNLLYPEISIAADGTYESVAIVQAPPSLPDGIEPTLRSHRIALGLFDWANGSLTRSRRVEIDLVGARTPVPELTGSAVPELLLLNDGDLTFAKIRLDEKSARTAIQGLGDIEDSLARALVWGAAWDMTRDAEMSTGDYLTLALSGLVRETDVGAVQQVIAQVKASIEQYASPDNRPQYRDRLAAGTHKLLIAASAKSDHQLAYMHAFTKAARTREHSAVLRAILDGVEVPEGLAVDTDLRWTLLAKLVVLGAATNSDIDHELQRDDTASGRVHAAYCRAAIPSVEAKEAAWAAAVDSDDLPNSILTATIGGFVQPDQRDLLRRYTDRYFSALGPVWSERTNETAQTVTIGLYPALLTDDDTLLRTDAFLDGHDGDVNPSARRLVSEGRDGVERALRAQRRDRTSL